MKRIEVVAAIIFYNEQILCVQRSTNKLSYISEKFEFPGGKIEQGESKIEALEREIMEELSVRVEIGRLFQTVIHQYPDFELTMHSFICTLKSKNITLNEHISFKWLNREKLINLDWAAADTPIVKKLIANE